MNDIIHTQIIGAVVYTHLFHGLVEIKQPHINGWWLNVNLTINRIDKTTQMKFD